MTELARSGPILLLSLVSYLSHLARRLLAGLYQLILLPRSSHIDVTKPTRDFYFTKLDQPDLKIQKVVLHKGNLRFLPLEFVLAGDGFALEVAPGITFESAHLHSELGIKILVFEDFQKIYHG